MQTISLKTGTSSERIQKCSKEHVKEHDCKRCQFPTYLRANKAKIQGRVETEIEFAENSYEITS